MGCSVRASALALLVIFSIWIVPLACEGRSREPWRSLAGEEDGEGGPVVLLTAPAPESANSTEKKTIAQMIDEALEQEFPEEKEEKIGKNYNETAKSSDVRIHAASPSLRHRSEQSLKPNIDLISFFAILLVISHENAPLLDLQPY